MATHDYNIANQTGANFRADLNNALSAILSNNASATEPTTTTAYMLWVDTTNNLLKMRNSSDDGWVTLPVSITTSNTVDIDGGTVNTITSLSFSSGETVTSILDEDDLSSDDASALATQQSIKAYVDSQVTAQDLDFQGDTGGALSIDLDSETFTISGGNGVTTSGSLNTLTIAIDSSVVTLTDTQTLTNKSIDADSNTISNLEVDNLKSGVLDTDLSDVSASDDTIASAKAIKTYVDSQVTAQDLDFQADSGGALSIDLDSETFTINGGTGIDTVGSENTVQINIDNTVATLSDTQTLTNKTIDADNNTVSNLEVDNLKTGVLDTDLASVSASDDTLASAKAIKTYVDAQVTAQDLDLTDGTTSISIDLDSEELSILGGTGVTSTASGNGVTLAIGQDVGTTANVTFNTVSADLTGDVTGDVTGTVSSIANHSTTDLTEGTNLYYTQARFDTAFSGKDTGDLTEGSNLYYTDERVDDRVSNLLVAGSNVTLTYNDVANTLTIAATEDNLSNNTTDDLAEGSTNLYYTDERVDDRVAALIQDGTGISWSYVDASGTLTPTISLSPFSTSDLSEGTNLYYTTARFDSAFSGKSTSDLTEGTNLYYTTARFDSAFSGKSTSDLTEGTNLYYTDARFDTRLATKTTDDVTEGTNLYFTTARIDSHLSGGTGVTYSSGTISIGQAVGTSDNVTFGDVIVSGDLTVSGTTTTVNTETVTIADNIIVLNSNATGTPSENSGIEIERGDATNKTLIWDETNDKWTVGSETFVAATFEGNVTGNVTGTVSDISNHNTDDLSEGASNLYYTTARFDSAFSGKSTSDLTEGTNLYYTTARANSDFDTRLATKSTTDLSEGTNLYYTTARFDTAFSGKDTDDLTEGTTNLYYTDARVDSHLSGGTGVTYTSGVISIGQAVGTTDDVTFNTVTATDEFLGDIDGAIQTAVRNTTGSTIYKGQAVYVTGLSGDTPTVALAKANSASTMPAVGIARADINNNSTGQMTVLGKLEGIDTSGSNNLETGVTLSINDVLYVSATEAGNITNVAPTGESNLIQNLGRVVRVSPNTNMTFSVQGAGRTNATPNLNSGKIFYGNGSNQSVPTTLDTSIVPENTNLYYTDARFDTRLATKTTDNLTEGSTNLYYTTARFDTAFSGKTTDNLTEGSTNLYFTDERVDDRVSNLLIGGTGITVTYNDVANTLTIDGSAQYGDSDVEAYLSGGTGVTFSSGVISIGQSVATSDSPTFQNLTLSGTDSIKVPSGTTAQRNGTPTAGMFRYNSETGEFEGYTTEWGAIAGSGGASAMETDNFTGDGSTTAFTLSSTVASEDNLIVFIEGVFQNKADYVASGTTITFDVAPASGRNIVVFHVKAAISGSNCLLNSFTGDGADTTFTLSQNPASENNTQVFIDGVYQQKDSYSVSGTTLTFDAAPANGTAIEVMMFTQTELNTIPSTFVSGLTEVTATGSDHLMIYDATDGALKKALASDLIETVGSTPTFSTATVTGDLTVDTDTLYVDSTNNRVGIGTSSPSYKLEVAGDASFLGQDVLIDSQSGYKELRHTQTGENFAISSPESLYFIMDSNNDQTSRSIIFAHNNTAPASATELMRIGEDGNVGIGTSSPDRFTISGGGSVTDGTTLTIDSGSNTNKMPKLELAAYNVANGNDIGQIIFGHFGGDATADGYGVIAAERVSGGGDGDIALTFGTGTSGTERMRIDSSGWVSINNTSRSSGAFENLAVDGWITSFDGTTTALFGASGSETYVGSFSNHSLVFRTNNTERMKIDTSGRVIVTSASTSTSNGYLYLKGNTTNFSLVVADSVGSNFYPATFRNNSNTEVGSISATQSATSYNTSSDYRLKENVVEMDGAIDRVKLLQPKRFNFIATPEDTVDGFLAHEVQDIVPEAIHGVKDEVDEEGNPVYQGIDQSKLVPLLTKAIQEQQVLIEQLQAEVALLKGE